MISAFLKLPWNWEPWILSGLGIALILYLAGLRRMPRNVRRLVVGPARIAAFAAAIAILFSALISPLDALDDQLFCAHMAQHLVLIMIAPLLLVAGRPAIASLWAFPLPLRRALGRFYLRSGLHDTVRALMSPTIVWVLCSAVLWFWHLPGPYGWAVENEFVHAVEHICFLGTSMMFWSLVLEPTGRHRRLGHAAALIFVATIGIQNGLLGALLTFSARPLYSAYFSTTAAWGLTPLEDQQLGGLGMWIPASAIHLTTLGALFIAWLNATPKNHRALDCIGLL
jgi:cytochrome c oxidase assembly factor CtaG